MKKSLLTFFGILILTLIKTPTLQGQSCSERLAHDSLELIKLYNATNGANWKHPWDLTRPVSAWSGVALTNDGCSVKTILLWNEGLIGSISNLDLPNLELLDLSNNQLSGSIPSFDFPKLASLSLTKNQLSGSIPNFDFPKLEALNLSYNQLSELIPNFDFPKLDFLILANNQLSGEIPNFDFPKLSFLSLSNNQLNRSIPDFDLQNLAYLYLDNNQLSGSIPNFDLPNLSFLTLATNQLSGSIPNFDFPNLERLNLFGNQLSGSIPNFDFPKLDFLTLATNQLSGDIPNFDLPKLKRLYLFGNQLSGPIPNFGNLQNLYLLNLEYNQLSGSIPNFDHFPKLGKLYLDNNQLSGDIPNFDLPNLRSLYLYNNNFTFKDIPSTRIGLYFRYIPQNPIPIYTRKGHKLYVNVGGGIQNNTYAWYKDGQKHKTIVGDSLLIITEPGSYYCKVTNSVIKGLVLQSNALDICLLNRDRSELIKLYNATDGANWKHPWDLTQPVSTWHGVGSTNDGCSVSYINLSNEGLTGSIPNLNLPNLISLNLSKNQLSGSIPNFDFQKLWFLSLSSNQLSGEVPNFDFPKLKYLYLGNNQLSETIGNFDHLPSLRLLDVTNNYFTFKDIEFNLNDINKRIRFNPQHLIDIYKSEEPVLYVKTGGGVHNNTYTWYKNDEEHKTIVGDSTLIVNLPGVYYCKIVNNALSQGNYSSNFVLQSNSTFVSISDLVANRLTRGIPPQESGIILFPNPAKGRVSIAAEGINGKRLEIRVFDRLGNLCLERSINQSTNANISLDVSSLSSGHYYLRIQVEGKAVVTKTLIIAR